MTFGFAAADATDAPETLEPGQMTQARLREELSRFAVRYAALMDEVLDQIKRTANTPENRLLAQSQKVALTYALIDVVMGPTPEVNTLDMIVLVTLVRDMVADYWVPKVATADGSERLLAAARQGQEDVWALADKILSTDQQEALRNLITSWRAKNPDVTNVFPVRFGNFAKELDTAAVARFGEPSGLFPEISQASRSVDEVRRTAERAVFLASMLPTLARYETESTVFELATQAETKTMLASMDRFSRSAEAFTKMVGDLPELVAAERNAAIADFMGALAEERQNAIEQARAALRTEREALFADLDAREAELRGVMREVRETVVTGNELATTIDTTAATVNETVKTVDSLTTRMGWGSPDQDEEPFPIQEYQAAAQEIAQAARELNVVLTSLDQLVGSGTDAAEKGGVLGVLERIDSDVKDWIILAFALGALLIAFVLMGSVLAVLAFRRISRRSSA